MAVTNFSIPWDCPDCGCGSDSSSNSGGGSASWDGHVIPCGESILTVKVHAVRAADPSIGVDALDVYVTGYVPSAFYNVGDSVYNSYYWDCTCTIAEILNQKCYNSTSEYYSDWNATTPEERWSL